jgi:membrane-associated phospholipid phosphatase
MDEATLVPFWHFITRLGEVQIFLPVALFAALGLVHQGSTRPMAWGWLAWGVLAATLTTLTKLAFLGWGVGIAALDFTGISGHAMFAASVYPTVLGVLTSHQPVERQRIAVVAGSLLALAVGVSRIAVDAHSGAEVVAGLALGALVSIATLRPAGLPRLATGPGWMAAAVALWLAFTPLHAPQSKTHGYVTQLSLMLAGTQVPHTRAQLRQALRAPAAARH